MTFLADHLRRRIVDDGFRHAIVEEGTQRLQFGARDTVEGVADPAFDA